MNISTSVAVEGTDRLVTVTSDIELHEDTVWSIASQALATAEGLPVHRLSRHFEAYEIRSFNNKFTRTPYVARFADLSHLSSHRSG